MAAYWTGKIWRDRVSSFWYTASKGLNLESYPYLLQHSSFEALIFPLPGYSQFCFLILYVVLQGISTLLEWGE